MSQPWKGPKAPSLLDHFRRLRKPARALSAEQPVGVPDLRKKLVDRFFHVRHDTVGAKMLGRHEGVPNQLLPSPRIIAKPVDCGAERRGIRIFHHFRTIMFSEPPAQKAALGTVCHNRSPGEEIRYRARWKDGAILD